MSAIHQLWFYSGLCGALFSLYVIKWLDWRTLRRSYYELVNVNARLRSDLDKANTDRVRLIRNNVTLVEELGGMKERQRREQQAKVPR